MDTELHEMFRQLRLRQGMSIVDLASETGISQSAISRIESGENEPRFYTAMRILKALGVGDIFKDYDGIVGFNKYPGLLRAAADALDDVIPILERIRALQEVEVPDLPKVAEPESEYRTENEDGKQGEDEDV